MNDLAPLVDDAKADFEMATTPAELENAKARYLGKSGRVTEQLKALATLPVDEKKAQGAAEYGCGGAGQWRGKPQACGSRAPAGGYACLGGGAPSLLLIATRFPATT